ncbi:MAG TPA: carbamoyltransferase HypF [Verrucomicrobia bacterium]|nr:MAG: carbamoyltransferase HypF [Lentisphaerae bacterium GWF2_57_35]HBA83867.1 carbamoyltransferase HypF [Verrucomicrobiota bacterium]
MTTQAVTKLFRISGAVQGVGFRPFVYRLAVEMNIPGWVRNDGEGVTILATAATEALEVFRQRLEQEAPPAAQISGLTVTDSPASPIPTGFSILSSDDSGAKTVRILPDLAICLDCLRELFDPNDRRYRYPFINCTHCGPRFSIVEKLPYDRPNTTMKHFELCPRCRAEYEDPTDRRFHAQPIACPECGPRLSWQEKSEVSETDALAAAAAALRAGRIVAVKGLGGFHLTVDARNEESVRELRRRKHREEKPFALMYPSMDSVRMDCETVEAEEQWLRSAASPIVLLRRKPAGHTVCPSVAPRNPYLGVMLPYTPLHHLLMRELDFPVVATSGNLSDEPICIANEEALERLGCLADGFLLHNRPIARPMDDSIVRLMAGQRMVLRRARGYAPYSLSLKGPSTRPLLAVGAHLKSTVAMAIGSEACVSQHIGDLSTQGALEAFERAAETLQQLYGMKAQAVACDLHPDYHSTLFAKKMKLPLIPVQHHHAHIAGCMAENGIEGPVLGVAWDGTGYGPDRTVWGGEFLVIDGAQYRRAAHFRTFRLPGGDQASVEARRSAMSILYELFGAAAFDLERPCLKDFSASERANLLTLLQKGFRSPWTSSAGRLFDAAASLLDINHASRFEGQAAMELEFAIGDLSTEESYPFEIRPIEEGPRVIDWAPLFQALLADTEKHVPTGLISARFHNTLLEIIVVMARQIGAHQVVLSGGCFQNKYLTEKTMRRLSEEGFQPFQHQHIPPNDGGIALGQLAVARNGE